MNTRELIKKLLGIEVETDDLEALQASPEEYAATTEEADKLRDLFMLMEYLNQGEVPLYDING